MTTKSFTGARLRRLREHRGLAQIQVARQLGISPSYYNQIENNHRPLTAPLQVRAGRIFGVDRTALSEEGDCALVEQLHEALLASTPHEPVSRVELAELARSMPSVGRALLALARRHREALDRVELLATQTAGEGPFTPHPLAIVPYEEVRDFFYEHHNYMDLLDRKAERLAHELRVAPGEAAVRLASRLLDRHRIQVTPRRHRGSPDTITKRHYDPTSRTVFLEPNLNRGQQAFQLATQLAFLEAPDEIERLSHDAFSSDEARQLGRIGLAHYFAGAVLLPYRQFLDAAENVLYDIEALERQFDVGFETICHRLSTLQRAEASGVPFLFVRVDRAGNISKRQSATGFHFSRIGGSCPLWNVYEAFSSPGRILRQIAELPDGQRYLWLARTVIQKHGGYAGARKTFAIGLGCDIQHAHRLVYSRGLTLDDALSATPIGVGCKVCERTGCPQRAFPPLGRPLAVDENTSRFDPYRTAAGDTEV